MPEGIQRGLPQVSEDEKSAALQLVLNSQTFARSEQLRAFLQFLCEQEMAGRGAELTEHVIGAEMFGRPDGYSTAEDAIVRSRAYALRHRLFDFYAQECPAAKLRIEVPKGVYCPRFVPGSLVANHPAGDVGDSPGSGDASGAFRRAGWSAAIATLVLLVGVVGFLAGKRSSASPVPEALSEAWAPFLRTDEKVLICIATPYHLLVRQGPPSVERSWWTPITGIPGLPEGFQMRHQILPGNQLYVNSADNSVLYGDVSGALMVAQFLTQARVPYEVLPERVVNPSAIRDRNVVLLGRAEYSRSAAILMKISWFQLHFYKPMNGEAVCYPSPRPDQPTCFPQVGKVQGLVTVVRSGGASEPKHHTIIISGSNSAGAQAAAEFITSPAKLGLLQTAFHQEGLTKWPEFWQVVVETGEEEILPLQIDYKAHRVLAR